MSENTPLLFPHLENAIPSRVFGMIQEEIGVLTTNLFQERSKNEAFVAQRQQDIITIQTLKQRLSEMESQRIEMQKAIDDLRNSQITSKSKKRRPT